MNRANTLVDDADVVLRGQLCVLPAPEVRLAYLLFQVKDEAGQHGLLCVAAVVVRHVLDDFAQIVHKDDSMDIDLRYSRRPLLGAILLFTHSLFVNEAGGTIDTVPSLDFWISMMM